MKLKLIKLVDRDGTFYYVQQDGILVSGTLARKYEDAKKSFDLMKEGKSLEQKETLEEVEL